MHVLRMKLHCFVDWVAINQTMKQVPLSRHDKEIEEGMNIPFSIILPVRLNELPA